MVILILILVVVLILIRYWYLKPIYCLSLKEFSSKIDALGQCFIIDDRRFDIGYPLMWTSNIGNMYLINKPIWSIDEINLKAQTIKGVVVEDHDFKQKFTFTLLDDRNARIEREDGTKVDYRYLDYCSAY